MENLEKMRHTLSHVLAAAVKELYPTATFGIGPNFHEFHHDFVDALLDTTTYYGAF